MTSSADFAAPALLSHAHLFAFESDFVANLRCVPMAVRLKLDRSGQKVTLRHWTRLHREDRLTLLETPCATPRQAADYAALVRRLVAARTGQTVPPLAEPPDALAELEGPCPPVLENYARSIGVRPPGAAEWARLDPLQRFALLKLSRDNHDNVNFVPALREFGLAPA